MMGKPPWLAAAVSMRSFVLKRSHAYAEKREIARNDLTLRLFLPHERVPQEMMLHCLLILKKEGSADKCKKTGDKCFTCRSWDSDCYQSFWDEDPEICVPQEMVPMGSESFLETLLPIKSQSLRRAQDLWPLCSPLHGQPEGPTRRPWEQLPPQCLCPLLFPL